MNILNVVHSTISSSLQKIGASSLPQLSCPSCEVVESAKNDNYISGESVSEFYEGGQTAVMKPSLTLEAIKAQIEKI